MNYKILKLVKENQTSRVLMGIPFPTGMEFEPKTEDEKIASRLLKFIDGKKNLNNLLEDLPITPLQLVQAICLLYDAGTIAFDQSYCDEFFVEEPEVSTDSHPDAPSGIKQQKSAEGNIEIEIIEQGNMEETPLWQKLNQLERKFLTGRLAVTSSKGLREIFFLNGNLQSAKSNIPEEDIGFMLFEKKKLSKIQYESYKKEMLLRSSDPYLILIDIGAFPAHQKLMAQRWASQVIVFNALSEKSGVFIIEKWDRLPKEIPRLGLNLKGIMSKFMAEVLPVEEEAEKLKDKMDWWLVPLSTEIERNLTEKEQRLWEIIIEKPRRLRDIMVLTTMFKKDTMRFILSLLTGGLVEMVKHPPVEEGPINLNKLDEAYEIMMESNYFDVLMVHAISDTEDIKKSYEKIIKKFNLSLYREITEEQKKKLLEMKKKVEEAWEELKEENTRMDYRKKVFSEYQLKQYATLQYQKGEIYLWWRQDEDKAFEYFKSAMELDPQNPLYQAACAYCAAGGAGGDLKMQMEAGKIAEKVASNPLADAFTLILSAGTLKRKGRISDCETLLNKARQKAKDTANIEQTINMVIMRSKTEKE